MGHLLLPSAVPMPWFQLGSSAGGSETVSVGSAPGKPSWHRASGEQNPDLGVPVASEACGNLPLGKGKTLRLTCFPLEITSLSGTGVCGFVKLLH